MPELSKLVQGLLSLILLFYISVIQAQTIFHSQIQVLLLTGLLISCGNRGMLQSTITESASLGLAVRGCLCSSMPAQVRILFSWSRMLEEPLASIRVLPPHRLIGGR